MHAYFLFDVIDDYKWARLLFCKQASKKASKQTSMAERSLLSYLVLEVFC